MRVRNLGVDLTATVISLCVALMAAGAGLDNGTLSEGRFLVSALVTVPAIGLLWWRRAHPVAVALTLLVPAAVTDMVGGATAIAVFTVAVHRPLRTALGLATAHVLVAVPLSVRYPDPDLQVAGANTLAVALFAIAVAWGATVRARRELIASLRERAARAEREADQQAEVLRGLERERIAREMHDVLAHRISLISLHAGALEIRRDLTRDQIAAAGGTIRASAHQAMEELRDILGVLRTTGDDDLRPHQTLADLDALLADARAAGMRIELHNEVEDPATLAPAVNRTAFRLIQEGLTNARKHAPGAPVSVTLTRCADEPHRLHVLVRNALPSAPVVSTVPGTRSGLVGLGERVALAGGRFQHGARKRDAGPEFVVEAWLPWEKP